MYAVVDAEVPPKAGRLPERARDKRRVQMAEGLNKVMLLGNLGADPELRVTPGGQSILKLRLATTERYLDRNQTWQERTDWHRITVWGKRGEALSKILQKGSNIFVEGRLQTSSYEKNGEKRYSTDVIATNIILTGGRGRGAGAERGPSEGGGYGGGGLEAPRNQPANDAGDDFAAVPADDDIPF